MIREHDKDTSEGSDLKSALRSRLESKVTRHVSKKSRGHLFLNRRLRNVLEQEKQELDEQESSASEKPTEDD